MENNQVLEQDEIQEVFLPPVVSEMLSCTIKVSRVKIRVPRKLKKGKSKAELTTITGRLYLKAVYKGFRNYSSKFEVNYNETV